MSLSSPTGARHRLLREGYREAGKTKNRTLANLSHWPSERIGQLRAVLRGERLLPTIDSVEIVRALPHGHVLAAVATAQHIDLAALLPRRGPHRKRDHAIGLIIARMLDPAAKLAYYLEWHMRHSLAPMMFDEHDPTGRDAQRSSPVAKAGASPAARRKAATKQTDPAHGEPLPVHSFRNLLDDLATMTRNTVRLGRDRVDILLAVPTKLQSRAFDLLNISLVA